MEFDDDGESAVSRCFFTFFALPLSNSASYSSMLPLLFRLRSGLPSPPLLFSLTESGVDACEDDCEDACEDAEDV